MNFLSAESLAKSYNEKWLFKNLSIGISQGEKIALVGINGSGKSTLLNILAGKITPDEGKVVTNKDIKVGYLNQNPEFEGNHTVTEALFAGDNHILSVIREYERCLNEGATSEQLQTAMEKMDDLKAWDYEQKVKEIITKMGIKDLTQKIGNLSGGQKKRVAMARLLIEEPDLLIMDEPTNHLDLDTIEWLENMLSAQNITLLLVTHDRYFLDKVANTIYELDNGKLFTYKGNYSYFVEKKAEREIQTATELDKAKQLLKKELDWMRKQPRARGTKAKSRVDAFYDLQEKASVVKAGPKLELNVQTTRQGGKVYELDHVSKAYGQKKLIDNFSYTFKKKDRIGIVGKNGIGKSTFMNLLTGIVTPDTGKIDKGQTTTVGYFSQDGLEIKEDRRVIEVVKDIAEVITLGTGETIGISKFLEHFQFTPAMQYTYISKLSGGEKKRLQLLKILVTNPNFLILDEPTNDLDIATLNVLEEFLQNFNGSLLVVSHDRYFMDQLVDHVFVFEGEGKIRDFPGNYTDYRSWMDEQELEKTKPKPVSVKVKSGDEKKKLSYNEKKEYESIEKEIAELELKKEGLLTKLNSGSGNNEELIKWGKEIATITDQLEEKSLRWLELSEKA
ncbi:MAG TPA: ABC-F family ATP-binding cassette domain-containing protein [Cytophagaceae bacterium]|jgi:ATP-binding cassette subfamily F protein uup|nr:ABC-F family ATP-binding cassette domain-containing protein [Cytophagaceae bacterium]